MNIREYVKQLYDALPKSHFNDQELVVVLEIENSDYGYGSHSYSGLGVDRDVRCSTVFRLDVRVRANVVSVSRTVMITR